MSSSFALLGVPEQLVSTLSRRGIDEPFPIQAATVPDAVAGRDVAGRAPTGSGKTLAFGLAMAVQAAAAGPPKPRRPRALVLVPTRELAAQVQRELQQLVAADAGPVATVYGGVGYGPQRKALARGVSAVVACPGRLEDLVGTGDVVLDRVDLVVLDEADRMADMGFMPAVKRLLDRTPERRQTLLFSATLDGDVDALVRRYQRDPVRHEVAGTEADVGDVTHLFWRLPRAERIDVTRDVVTACGPTIVFCRTCHGADRVAKQLDRAGVPAVAIHGRRSQAQRDRALAAFTKGRAPALVATDVAARGIHVDHVGAVVHYDLPDDPKDYVHRSGRTGRAGATGIVVALAAAEDGEKKVRALWRRLDGVEPVGPVDLDRLTALAASVTGTGMGAATGGSGGRSRREAAPALVGAATDEATDATTPADGHTPGGTAGDRTRGGEHGGRGPRGSRRSRRDGGDRRPGGRHGGDGPGGDRPRRGGPRRDGDGRSDRDDARDGDGRGGDRRRPSRAGSVSGTVTAFHADKGYGFIARQGKSDVFVHTSNVGGGRALSAGQRVRFEVVPGRRGVQAVNVRPA